jgi:DnaJ-class molecular chaperone
LATQAKRDYYEILSVSRTATEQEIKSAFMNLAAEFHTAGKPKNIDDVESFCAIARAYRILGDPEQRRRYDQFGENGIVLKDPPSGFDVAKLEQLVFSQPHWEPALGPVDDFTVEILDKLFFKE